MVRAWSRSSTYSDTPSPSNHISVVSVGAADDADGRRLMDCTRQSRDEALSDRNSSIISSIVGLVVFVFVRLRRGTAVCGPWRDCLSILGWTGGCRDRDVDEDADVDAGTKPLREVDAGPGRPGSVTEPLSMALQSIQASRRCDQARAS